MAISSSSDARADHSRQQDWQTTPRNDRARTLDRKIYVVPGWGERTRWHRNIAVDPHVTVQRRGETFAANAVPVTDKSELTAVFQHFQKTSPMFKPFLDSWGIEDNLRDFLSKSDRIVALRLDRKDGSPPLPPLRVDLWWIWVTLAVLGVILSRWGH